MFTDPTVDDFKTYFFRDFPYTFDGDYTGVTPPDIQKAIGQASFNFNPALVGTQEEYTLLFLYLTAHYLVVDLRASSQGIAGQYSWLTSSKSVGSVSEGISIPQRILDNPELAMLSKTSYGAKYLQLILPQLAGQIFSSRGGTHP